MRSVLGGEAKTLIPMMGSGSATFGPSYLRPGAARPPPAGRRGGAGRAVRAVRSASPGPPDLTFDEVLRSLGSAGILRDVVSDADGAAPRLSGATGPRPGSFPTRALEPVNSPSHRGFQRPIGRASIRPDAGRDGRTRPEAAAPDGSASRPSRWTRSGLGVGVAVGDMVSVTSDASELIGRMVRGDRSGLEGLYDRYAQLLFNLVIRIVRDRSDAEEVHAGGLPSGLAERYALRSITRKPRSLADHDGPQPGDRRRAGGAPRARPAGGRAVARRSLCRWLMWPGRWRRGRS